MQIRWLQTFRAVVDEGGFEMAARAMNCTQSTVSFQIKRLEESLGVQLFDRVGRKMQINEAGMRCLREVDEILSAYERLKIAGSGTQALSGTLRVAVPESLLTLQMQPVFSQFRKAAPAVRVIAEPRNCYSIGDHLAAGDYDLAVYYDVEEMRDVLDVTPLAQYDLGLFASGEVDSRELDFVRPGSKNPVTFITNDAKSVFTRAFLSFMRKNKIRVGGLMEISSVEAVKRCVMSNMGVAYMPCHIFDEELRGGRVQLVKTGMSQRSVTCVLARHRNKTATVAAKLFTRLTLEHFAHMAPGVPAGLSADDKDISDVPACSVTFD